MKKNMMLRIASVMLVAVMMSTCAISGTFAKYVTSGISTDSARVAKFGVVVVANSGAAFAQTYNSDTAGYTGLTVEATEKVVAPGTTGTLANISITGTTEVAVKVSHTAELTLSNWSTDGSDVYCPIVFTVGGTDYYIGATESIADFELRVENAIKGVAAKEFGPNATLDADNLNNVVSWKWYIDDLATGNPLSTYQTDVKDTLLGRRAVEDATKPTVQLSITTTVTQID
jgi:hypothetical protein